MSRRAALHRGLARSSFADALTRNSAPSPLARERDDLTRDGLAILVAIRMSRPAPKWATPDQIAALERAGYLRTAQLPDRTITTMTAKAEAALDALLGVPTFVGPCRTCGRVEEAAPRAKLGPAASPGLAR